ncbi:MAG TPA: hypothetical protein VFC25_05015 [Verrucomicrobiae bacterium]|nr:hypothetical protein [Verrucomicrobiae bacterium]
MESRRQTLFTLATLILGGAAVNYVPNVPLWAVILGGTVVAALWAWMKSNYTEIAKIRAERDVATQEQEGLRKKLKEANDAGDELLRITKLLVPYKQRCDEWDAIQEKDEKLFPFQQLDREIGVMLIELRDLAYIKPEKASSLGIDVSLRNAYMRAIDRQPRRSPEQIASIYGLTHAAKVLELKARLEAIGLTSRELEAACTHEPRTPETVLRVAEALEGLRIRLSPMTQAMD